MPFSIVTWTRPSMTRRWTSLRPSSRLSPTIDVLSCLSMMNLADGWFWGYPFRLHCWGPIVEQWWSYNRFICLALFMSQLKMALIVRLWKSEPPFKHLNNANQKVGRKSPLNPCIISTSTHSVHFVILWFLFFFF
jgi:hypothetical protein